MHHKAPFCRWQCAGLCGAADLLGYFLLREQVDLHPKYFMHSGHAWQSCELSPVANSQHTHWQLS